MKLKPVTTTDDKPYGWSHWCPGCERRHVIPMTGPNPWDFNGDVERPTFSPSVKHNWTWGEERTRKCCHYFLVDGNMQFCSDCTHPLAGQTVPLPEIPER